MDNVKNFDEMQEKKLYTEIITLPSGKVVELRGMKTQEMDILASKKAMKDGAGINDIAKSCILNLNEFDYDNALQGDRYSILINIRRITYPGPYSFDITCPQCEQKGSFNVILEDLPVKTLNNETTNLKFEFPRSKYKITYHLPTGVDEREVLKLRKRHLADLMSLSLMTNIDKVEGLKFKTLEWFKNLDAYDVISFQNELEEKNCGVETSIELCCDSCGAEFETELPITSNFFLPKKRRKI
jgi:hypothetical protein